MSYFQSFIFGLTIALSIGPIAILILNQSINCGLKNGALCGLGAATADLTYALIAFTFGNVLFSLLESYKGIIPLISAVILILFGIWMIFTMMKKKDTNKAVKYSLTCRYPFVTTYGLTIANPLTIIVFASFAGIVSSENESNIFIHAIIIFIASLIIQLIIAFAGSHLARFFSNPKTLLYFNLISALGIIILGITKLI